MTRYERAYRNLVVTDYEAAVKAYYELLVHELLEDGPEEVVRVLTLWTVREGGLPRIALNQDFLVELHMIQTDPESRTPGSARRWAIYSGPAGSEPSHLVSRHETREEAHQDAHQAVLAWIRAKLAAAAQAQRVPLYADAEVAGQGGWIIHGIEGPLLAYLVVEEDPGA